MPGRPLPQGPAPPLVSWFELPGYPCWLLGHDPSWGREAAIPKVMYADWVVFKLCVLSVPSKPISVLSYPGLGAVWAPC